MVSYAQSLSDEGQHVGCVDGGGLTGNQNDNVHVFLGVRYYDNA